MLTVIFASLGSFIDEISSSIIKYGIDRKKQSIFIAGFINVFFGFAVISILAILRGSFLFSLASLPTFAVRAVLEIIKFQMTMLAIAKSDRSTFAFVRNLTIPLLLIVDLISGFSISGSQGIGLSVIFAVLIIILSSHILDFKGIGYSLFTAVNAVATISLFKYDTSHFNSVEGEQIIIYAVLLAYFFLIAKFLMKENPFSFLRNKLFLIQGSASGLASAFQAFAIFFGNPGIALAAERASAILAAIISGHNYFQEKKLFAKIFVSLGLAAGLVLLIK